MQSRAKKGNLETCSMQKVLHTAFPSHGESFSNSHVQKMQLFLAMANKKLTSLLARPTKSVASKLPK